MKFEPRRTIRALPEIVKREVRKEEAGLELVHVPRKPVKYPPGKTLTV
jgi:hypothetical protein